MRGAWFLSGELRLPPPPMATPAPTPIELLGRPVLGLTCEGPPTGGMNSITGSPLFSPGRLKSYGFCGFVPVRGVDGFGMLIEGDPTFGVAGFFDVPALLSFAPVAVLADVPGVFAVPGSVVVEALA